MLSSMDVVCSLTISIFIPIADVICHKCGRTVPKNNVDILRSYKGINERFNRELIPTCLPESVNADVI